MEEERGDLPDVDDETGDGMMTRETTSAVSGVQGRGIAGTKRAPGRVKRERLSGTKKEEAEEYYHEKATKIQAFRDNMKNDKEGSEGMNKWIADVANEDVSVGAATSTREDEDDSSNSEEDDSDEESGGGGYYLGDLGGSIGT